MKKYNEKKQKRIEILLGTLIIFSLVLTFSLMLVYGFTERLYLGLIALSSASWFLLVGLYVYILVTNKKMLIKQDAFYKGKPITQKEATFFAYVYAVLFIGIGTILAIMFFRAICS